MEDYATGFIKTYEACAVIYNSPDYNEEDIETIKVMINAKIALYKEIDAALLLNTTEDAVLAAATANAKITFDTVTDASQVEAATSTLKDAEVAYSMGTGDISSLGQNMSFEDLSAQDGKTTSVSLTTLSTFLKVQKKLLSMLSALTLRLQ